MANPSSSLVCLLQHTGIMIVVQLSPFPFILWFRGLMVISALLNLSVNNVAYFRKISHQIFKLKIFEHYENLTHILTCAENFCVFNFCTLWWLWKISNNENFWTIVYIWFLLTSLPHWNVFHDTSTCA